MKEVVLKKEALEKLANTIANNLVYSLAEPLIRFIKENAVEVEIVNKIDLVEEKTEAMNPMCGV